MKPLWTGSDVLFLIKYPPSKKRKYIYMFCYRIFAIFLDFFAESHYVVSEHLIPELRKFGIKKDIKVLIDPPLYGKVEKKKHHTFNILYYRPIKSNQKYTDWVYGYDIIETVKTLFPDIHFIGVDGTQDMSLYYPYIDFYLRPNRHDGHPRMVMECEANNIPYYWSKEEPNITEIIYKIGEATGFVRGGVWENLKYL